MKTIRKINYLVVYLSLLASLLITPNCVYEKKPNDNEKAKNNINMIKEYAQKHGEKSKFALLNGRDIYSFKVNCDNTPILIQYGLQSMNLEEGKSQKNPQDAEYISITGDTDCESPNSMNCIVIDHYADGNLSLKDGDYGAMDKCGGPASLLCENINTTKGYRSLLETICSCLGSKGK